MHCTPTLSISSPLYHRDTTSPSTYLQIPMTPSPPHLNHSALLISPVLPPFLPSLPPSPNHPTDPHDQIHTPQPTAPSLPSPLRGEPSPAANLASSPASHKQDGVRHRCPSIGNTDPYTCTCMHDDYIDREEEEDEEEEEEKVRCVPRRDLRSVLVVGRSTLQTEERREERRKTKRRGGKKRGGEGRERREGWEERRACSLACLGLTELELVLVLGVVPYHAVPRGSADLRLSCVRAYERREGRRITRPLSRYNPSR